MSQLLRSKTGESPNKGKFASAASEARGVDDLVEEDTSAADLAHVEAIQAQIKADAKQALRDRMAHGKSWCGC